MLQESPLPVAVASDAYWQDRWNALPDRDQDAIWHLYPAHDGRAAVVALPPYCAEFHIDLGHITISGNKADVIDVVGYQEDTGLVALYLSFRAKWSGPPHP